MLSIFLLAFTLSFLSFCSFKNKNEDQKITQATPLSESMERGEKIYETNCLQCHLPDGKGTGNTVPPLANSDWFTEKRAASIHAVKFGLKGQITVNNKSYKGFMPKQRLEPQQLADVMNYIFNSWGNISDKIVTVEEVEKVTK